MAILATGDQISFFGYHIPYLEHLGVEPQTCEDDSAVVKLPIRPHLLNSRGHVHGGAIMSVLDFTLSAAGRAHDPTGVSMATIDMSTSFMTPGTTDLTITATCVHRGRSICFCEGEIRDADNQLVAKATASFKMIKANP